ncbi:hypothetical protein [Rugamonas sp.]|uniref:hypothetical protein n=1 Tax=Rugamonas sp. TaxID=1926287 RepID=UPI0025DE6E89|nr:hypothetical protein [Rugamonas sp.]
MKTIKYGGGKILKPISPEALKVRITAGGEAGAVEMPDASDAMVKKVTIKAPIARAFFVKPRQKIMKPNAKKTASC